MTKKLEEIKDWFEEHEEAIKFSCLCVGCELTCAVVGIFLGSQLERKQIAKGLEQCFKNDPTFKEHYAKVIAETYKINIMK